MIHKIKVSPDVYAKVKNKRRLFEIFSTEERHYGVGDTLHYCEVNENGEYTGRAMKKRITYIYEELEGLKDGYILLALAEKKYRRNAKPQEKEPW